MGSRLQESYRAARDITRHHAKTFYFSSHTLPKEKRYHAYAVYAFCRYVDDEIDKVYSPEQLPFIVESLKSFVQKICNETPEKNLDNQYPWILAFKTTTLSCEIPVTYYFDLLHGVLLDQNTVRIQNWDELREYCYYVAGVVGLMMTRVFGLEKREYEKEAINLGIAMQLTNILRDIHEDYQHNRIYIPQTELVTYGVSEEDIANQIINDSWKELLKFQIQRARNYYKKSEIGIKALPNNTQLTVWMMRVIYAEILTEIENRNYNIFQQRVHVSISKKLLLVLRCIGHIF
jgi:phytoene synthase